MINADEGPDEAVIVADNAGTKKDFLMDVVFVTDSGGIFSTGDTSSTTAIVKTVSNQDFLFFCCFVLIVYCSRSNAALDASESARVFDVFVLVSVYNSTASTWTLETPRTAWECKQHKTKRIKVSKKRLI